MEKIFKIVGGVVVCTFLFTIIVGRESLAGGDYKKKGVEEPSTAKEKVNISLEKKNYKPGEEVKVTIDSNKPIYVWGGYHWTVQRWENKNWVDIWRSGCKTYLAVKY